MSDSQTADAPQTITPVTIDVLAHAFDPDQPLLQLVDPSNPGRGTLQIVPERAAVVRSIFEMAAADMGIKRIAEALTHRDDAKVLSRIRRQVFELAEQFPLYAERRSKSAVAAT